MSDRTLAEAIEAVRNDILTIRFDEAARLDHLLDQHWIDVLAERAARAALAVAIPKGWLVLEPGRVPVPRSVDEAKAMWLSGERWIRDNAPEALRAQATADGRVEAMRESENANLVIDVLSRCLLDIAARPSWESVAGRSREPGLALKPFYEGFDCAARSRADRARDALETANIVRPMTDEIAAAYRALPSKEAETC